MDSSIWQWKMNSEFQSLVRFRIARTIFRIPKTRILDSTSKFCRTTDSTSKNFLDSGILDYRIWGEVTVILALYGIKKNHSILPYCAVTGGDDLNQWWIGWIRRRKVNIEYETSPAVRRVHRTGDKRSNEVHAVFILNERRTKNNKTSKCLNDCIQYHSILFYSILFYSIPLPSTLFLSFFILPFHFISFVLFCSFFVYLVFYFHEMSL